MHLCDSSLITTQNTYTIAGASIGIFGGIKMIDLDDGKVATALYLRRFEPASCLSIIGDQVFYPNWAGYRLSLIDNHRHIFPES